MVKLLSPYFLTVCQPIFGTWYFCVIFVCLHSRGFESGYLADYSTASLLSIDLLWNVSFGNGTGNAWEEVSSDWNVGFSSW